VYRGREAIVAYFEEFQRSEPGLQFTQESLESLARDVVVSYETAGNPADPARCFHVFQVRRGLVQDEHWVVYFAP
jgi:hypothetical protein